MDDNTTALLTSIVAGDFPPTSEPTPETVELFANIKKIYNSCMDEAGIKRAGLAPLQTVVQDVVQRFPVADSEYMDNTTYGPADYDAMANATSFMEKLGIPFLLSVAAVPNPVDPLVIIPGVFPYTPSLFSVDEIPQMAGYLRKVYVSQAAKDASLKLARGVSNIYEQLRVMFKSMDSWDSALQRNMAMLDSAVASSPGLVLDKGMAQFTPEAFRPSTISLAFPDYYVAVSKILAKVPKADVQAAMVLETIMGLTSYVDPDALESNRTESRVRHTHRSSTETPFPRREDHHRVRRGSTLTHRNAKRQQDSDRSSTCRQQVNRLYSFALGKLYLDAAYTPAMRSFARDIITDIKTSFNQTLSNTTWMDAPTLEKAQVKAAQIPAKVGYPDINPNDTSAAPVLAYYAGFNISSSLFTTKLSWSRWDNARQWAAVGRPSNRTDHWIDGVAVYATNAAYQAQYNDITFPAAMSQFPLFDPAVPSYFSMGAFGQVAGHELTHSFDNNGRHYDQNGAYADWWSAATVAASESRARCFVDQFAGMDMVDYTGAAVIYADGTAVRISGEQTLAENIADSGGLNTAFGAWKMRERREPPEQGLPGLEGFSKEQVFFLAAAQMWCHKESQDDLRFQIRADPHAPAFARIKGMMENTGGFLEAFGCAVREPRCKLW